MADAPVGSPGDDTCRRVVSLVPERDGDPMAPQSEGHQGDRRDAEGDRKQSEPDVPPSHRLAQTGDESVAEMGAKEKDRTDEEGRGSHPPKGVEPPALLEEHLRK